MMRVGAIFPGQGSQGVGMGTDVAAHSPASRAHCFDRAPRHTRLRLARAAARTVPKKSCARRATANRQSSRPTSRSTPRSARNCGRSSAPAIRSANSAVWSSPRRSGVRRRAAHRRRTRASDAARRRARAAAECPRCSGLNAEQRARSCRTNPEARRRAASRLANFNSPTQIVISGDLHAVQAAAEAMLAAGAKRVVPLNVSGAWHSELMEPAIERFAAAVEQGAVRDAGIRRDLER